MWLATPLGFFSVVRKPGDSHLTVRSRARADLGALRERYLPALTATVTGAGTDYPHRGTCTAEAWSKALAAMAQDIDYSNFKATVAARHGARRAKVYGHVWQQLLAIEREEA